MQIISHRLNTSKLQTFQVENLCLQLRVIRHLQSAEKERAIEKAHEINTLKSEVAFVKKQLSKTKSVSLIACIRIRKLLSSITLKLLPSSLMI